MQISETRYVVLPAFCAIIHCVAKKNIRLCLGAHTARIVVIHQHVRAHGVDARDVANALVSAITADCVGRTFDIAGSDAWASTSHEVIGRIFDAMGMPELPLDSFRMADPEVDESWYFQDHVDTTEAQRVLDYQRHSPEDYADAIRPSGLARFMMRLMGPLVVRRMIKGSPYRDSPRTPDPTPMRDVILETYGIDADEAKLPDPTEV